MRCADYIHYHIAVAVTSTEINVLAADGNVEQDSHYYPYGMLMGESGDILATARTGRNPLKPSGANPYLYGGKEYLTTAGANLLDFTARTYDPSTLLFHTPNPLRDRYLHVNPYLYCGADPVNFIDPTGMKLQLLGIEKDIEKAVALYEKTAGGSLHLSVNKDGIVSILADNRSNMELNQYQSTASTIIDRVINDKGLVTLNVVNNSENVIIGDVNTATIDIGDMLALGDDCHVNAGTTLMHETYEQFEIQTHKVPTSEKERNMFLAKAHCKAIGIENLMMNAIFEEDKAGERIIYNAGNNKSIIHVNNTWSFKDMIYYSTAIHLKRNNVKKVTEKKHKEKK